MRPRRPSGSSNKARFWQWAYDSIQELQPQSGPGILTCRTTRGIFQRMMALKNGPNNRKNFPDEPEFYGFGYGTNGWGPYATGTAVVGTAVWDPDSVSSPEINAPELQGYFTYNGSPVYYPGVLFPAGIQLPGTFRFTSPYRHASCRITGVTTGAPWQNPVPDILGPGESVDFNAPGSVGFGGVEWIARKI